MLLHRRNKWMVTWGIRVVYFQIPEGLPSLERGRRNQKKVMASLNWLALCIYSWHSLPCNASVWQPSFGGLSKYNDPCFRCKFNQHIYIICGRWWLRGLLLPYLLLPWPQKKSVIGFIFLQSCLLANYIIDMYCKLLSVNLVRISRENNTKLFTTPVRIFTHTSIWVKSGPSVWLQTPNPLDV